jgi:hypothetical protein
VYAFASPHDAAALGVYLQRLLGMDKTAAVRFVGIGPVAAAYAAPPLHGSTARASVLTVRTAALGEGTPPFDRTVSAGQLLESITTHDGDGDGNGGRASGFALPAQLTAGPSWAGLLPPRTGWRPLGELPLRQLAEVVAQGNADFRFGALGRDRVALDNLAEEIWTRELPHGVRWRAAHAASAMGFLGPQPEHTTDFARVATHTRWLRLDTPYGTILERNTAEL